jgi:hypothetical protein
VHDVQQRYLRQQLELLPGNGKLHVVRNSAHSDNNLLEQGILRLKERLPRGWRTELSKQVRQEIDGYLRLISPDQARRLLVVQTKSQLDPRGVRELEQRFQGAQDKLVIAPYLSAATRERLRAAAINYIDLTGNVRIEVSKPGLFIDTGGADVSPSAVPRGSRSLRGGRAGRVIRYLIDHRNPGGVRQIAEQTAVDPGYVSRVLALLDRETLIERAGRGKIMQVDWPRLLRRWAEEAPMEKRGSQLACLEPRGSSVLLEKLRGRADYFVTGSFAASKIAPVSAARLLTLYTKDMTAATKLGLRVTETGANVLLVDPSDEGVLRGARVVDRVQYVAVSQVAADLMGGSGREPAEGESLIEWMMAHEEEWRG